MILVPLEWEEATPYRYSKKRFKKQFIELQNSELNISDLQTIRKTNVKTINGPMVELMVHLINPYRLNIGF